MQKTVEASGIHKCFGANEALKEVSFSVFNDEIFGFIGPDGAGKTTLFRILTTLLLPDKGRIEIFGLDNRIHYKELRKVIGYMPGRFSLYQDLSVEENLKFYATVFGTTVKENYELISDIYEHLQPFRKRLAGKLSGGMKQKLALSCALIHKPKLLVLDEPTTGVDAVSRTEFWEILQRLKHNNITVIVSTPYMDEAMKCDRVALIQNGRIFTTDEPENITKNFNGKLFIARGKQKYRLLVALRRYHSVKTAYPFGDSIHVTFSNNSYSEDLIEYLEGCGLTGVEISETSAGIEDSFLQYIGKEMD